MSFALKARAICFILLFVGQEAARIHNGARAKVAIEELYKDSQNDPVSDEWQEANHACKWSTWNGGCMGPGNNTEACKLRYLPLDKPPPFSSQACRYTDEYMLETDRSTYFDLQAKLLAAKAKSFAQKCSNASSFNLKCQRRGKHMYRAMSFMAKAQDSKFTADLSEEQRLADKQLFEDSLSEMKVFAGQDADYVMKLKDKLQRRGRADFLMVEETVGILTMLLQGDAEEKANARKTIDSMSDAPSPLTEEEVEKQREIEGNLEAQEGKMNELLSKELSLLDSEESEDEPNIRMLGGCAGTRHGCCADGRASATSPDDPCKGNNSALVQMRTELALSAKDVNEVLHGIAFILIMFLVVSAVIWAVQVSFHIILGFLLLIIVGCGAYRMGMGDSGEHLVRTVINDCLFRLIAFPIERGAEAIKWVWDEFAPGSWHNRR